MFKLIALTLCLACGASAWAQETQRDDATPPAPSWAPVVEIGSAFATDGMFRGQSGTNSKAAMNAHAFVVSGPVYAGAIWMNKDLGPDNASRAEEDFLVGVTPQAGPLRFDFNVLYAHLVPDDTVDYWEFKAGVETDLPYGVVAAFNYYHSPNYVNFNIKEDVYELTWRKPLDDKWMLSGSAGRLAFGDSPVFRSYNWWDAGVSYNVNPSFKVDLRYHDTNLSRSDCFLRNSCKGRVVLGLAWSTTFAGPDPR